MDRAISSSPSFAHTFIIVYTNIQLTFLCHVVMSLLSLFVRRIPKRRTWSSSTSSSSPQVTFLSYDLFHGKPVSLLSIIYNNSSSIKRYTSNKPSHETTTTTTQQQQQTQNRHLPLRSRIRPRKPAVQLTPHAITFFKRLFTQIQNDTKVDSSVEQQEENEKNLNPLLGFRLMYQQSQSGQPRMVFTFDVIRKNQIGPLDER